MTFFDRGCLNEALDILLDRENGEGEKKTAEEDVSEDERLDREAARGEAKASHAWGDEDD